MELSFIWSLNHERKSLVLTDHDPNLGRYSRLDEEHLRLKLLVYFQLCVYFLVSCLFTFSQALREEENEAIGAVLERGEAARVVMERALRDIARRSQGESTESVRGDTYGPSPPLNSTYIQGDPSGW